MVLVSARVLRVVEYQKPAYIAPAIAMKTTNRRYQGRCGSLPNFISLILIVKGLVVNYFFIATWLAGAPAGGVCALGSEVALTVKLTTSGFCVSALLAAAPRSDWTSCLLGNFTVSFDVQIAKQPIRELQALTKLRYGIFIG